MNLVPSSSSVFPAPNWSRTEPLFLEAVHSGQRKGGTINRTRKVIIIHFLALWTGSVELPCFRIQGIGQCTHSIPCLGLETCPIYL